MKPPRFHLPTCFADVCHCPPDDDEGEWEDPAPGHPEITLDYDTPARPRPAFYKIGGVLIPASEYRMNDKVEQPAPTKNDDR